MDEERLVVRFLNYAGDDLLGVVEIEYGGNALPLAPTPEIIQGKTFKGWNADITHVTEDKKVCIFVLVGIANIVDTQVLMNGSAIRTAVIFFYLSNEGLSVLENSAVIGLPIPDKLKAMLIQLADEKKPPMDDGDGIG